MKIVLVVGARPQFIKAAPLIRAMEKYSALRHILVHTGQHYDIELSEIFFDELNIPKPDYNLEVGSDSHARQIGRMIIGLEDILVAEKPDLVLVYGDTNSTLAGALAAVKLHIPVAHVEAGPRMFDKSIPEEINRVVTDHVSSLLFAPTQTAVDNLKKEGILQGVYLTGDVMLDSFLYFSEVAERNSTVLNRLELETGEYLLATVHRARNTEFKENLEKIVDAFLNIEDTIVFPIHPRTDKYLKHYGLYERLKEAPNTRLIKPVGYLDSIMLTRNARKVLTDSGGLQKEAYFSQVPCITLDVATGWPETVENGWNTLVGSDKDRIIPAVKDFEPKGKPRDVFGDGKAAERIAGILVG
jgi:UDP-N-acetylglucosamine 2-epimerase